MNTTSQFTSNFWNIYIAVIVLFSFIGLAWLLLSQNVVKPLKKGEEVKKEIVVEKEKALSYEEQKERKKLTNQLSKVERQISDLEKEIARMNTQIQNTHTPELMEQYGNKKKQLDNLMEEWEKISLMINN